MNRFLKIKFVSVKVSKAVLKKIENSFIHKINMAARQGKSHECYYYILFNVFILFCIKYYYIIIHNYLTLIVQYVC